MTTLDEIVFGRKKRAIKQRWNQTEVTNLRVRKSGQHYGKWFASFFASGSNSKFIITRKGKVVKGFLSPGHGVDSTYFDSEEEAQRMLKRVIRSPARERYTRAIS